MSKLPMQYHLEVYEGSFRNDPSLAVESTTPLPKLSVGEYFDHRGTGNWTSPPATGEIFQIKEIEHIFWEIEGSHIGYKLMVCLAAVQKEW